VNTATFNAAVEGFGDVKTLAKVRKSLVSSRESVWGGTTKPMKPPGRKPKTRKYVGLPYFPEPVRLSGHLCSCSRSIADGGGLMRI